MSEYSQEDQLSRFVNFLKAYNPKAGWNDIIKAATLYKSDPDKYDQIADFTQYAKSYGKEYNQLTSPSIINQWKYNKSAVSNRQNAIKFNDPYFDPSSYGEYDTVSGVIDWRNTYGAYPTDEAEFGKYMTKRKYKDQYANTAEDNANKEAGLKPMKYQITDKVAKEQEAYYKEINDLHKQGGLTTQKMRETLLKYPTMALLDKYAKDMGETDYSSLVGTSGKKGNLDIEGLKQFEYDPAHGFDNMISRLTNIVGEEQAAKIRAQWKEYAEQEQAREYGDTGSGATSGALAGLGIKQPTTGKGNGAPITATSMQDALDKTIYGNLPETDHVTAKKANPVTASSTQDALDKVIYGNAPTDPLKQTGNFWQDVSNNFSTGMQMKAENEAQQSKYFGSALGVPSGLVKEGISAVQSAVYGTPYEWGIKLDPEQGITSKSYIDLYETGWRESAKKSPVMVNGQNVSQLYYDWLKKTPAAEIAIGSIMEMGLDPLNFIPIDAITKISELSKAGKTAEALDVINDYARAAEKGSATVRATKAANAARTVGEAEDVANTARVASNSHGIVSPIDLTGGRRYMTLPDGHVVPNDALPLRTNDSGVRIAQSLDDVPAAEAARGASAAETAQSAAHPSIKSVEFPKYTRDAAGNLIPLDDMARSSSARAAAREAEANGVRLASYADGIPETQGAARALSDAVAATAQAGERVAALAGRATEAAEPLGGALRYTPADLTAPDGITKANLSLTDRLGNLFGKKIEAVQSLTDRAGNALGVATDPATGKVLVSNGQEGLAARSKLIAGGMTESLGKSGQYEAFRDAVIKSIPEDELAASVKKFQGIYGSSNPALIEREVVNEWVSNNLYNSPAIKQIVSADPQLATGVREYLGGLKTKLGGMKDMQAVGREVEHAEGMWERAGRNDKRITLDTLNGNEYDGINDRSVDKSAFEYKKDSRQLKAKYDKDLHDTAKLSHDVELNDKHRISYKSSLKNEIKNFISGGQIHNTVEENMVLVQFHSKSMLGDGRSAKYWTTLEYAKSFESIDDAMNKLALLSKWGNRDVVSIAIVPKGTKIDYIVGKAKYKIDLDSVEFRKGGGLQILFDEFDPDWIVEMMTVENFFDMWR